MLQHTIRASADDPIKKCTFTNENCLPPDYAKRRVGRPRTNWVNITFQNIALKNNLAADGEDYKRREKDILEQIVSQAKRRVLI